MGRLNDTEALVRQGINRPGCQPAPFGGNLAVERGADNTVQGPQPGRFRRETGAGPEGLAGAKAELGK
jgi:hypothetical protein